MLGRLAHMKKKTVIQAIGAFVLVAVAGRFGWIAVDSVSSVQRADSPNKRFVAIVSSKWHDDFWGRRPHECHYVSVESADSQVVRHIFTDEPWTGWAKDCLIEWATNSASVAVTFKSEEARKTHLILDVSP